MKKRFGSACFAAFLFVQRHTRPSYIGETRLGHRLAHVFWRGWLWSAWDAAHG